MREVFKVISKRDDKLCNFVEGGPWGEGTRIVYRHYATLYFIFCVDESESELGILDLIQVFVESLDKCFENVCELDLVFHMDRVRLDMAPLAETRSMRASSVPAAHNPGTCSVGMQVHSIIDEIVQAGMVLETNIGEILKALDGQRKHEQATTKVEKTVLRDPNAPDPKAKRR